RERSIREGLPAIAVGRFDGLHLEVIARAIGALKAVEIGTLGGYSGVCLLRGMGVHGVLHTFEYSEKHARVASDSFHKAGVGARGPLPCHHAADGGRSGDGRQDPLTDLSALITSSARALRHARRRSRNSGRLPERMAMASRAAFAAPGLPMASVPTGIPFGIC